MLTEAFHHFGGRLLGNNDENTKLYRDIMKPWSKLQIQILY